MGYKDYKKCPKCGCTSYGQYYTGYKSCWVYCASCKTVYGEE